MRRRFGISWKLLGNSPDFLDMRQHVADWEFQFPTGRRLMRFNRGDSIQNIAMYKP